MIKLRSFAVLPSYLKQGLVLTVHTTHKHMRFLNLADFDVLSPAKVREHFSVRE